MDIIEKLLSFNVLEWVGAVVLLLNALIAVALLIPGEQPEKFLQGVVALLEKFSKK